MGIQFHFLLWTDKNTITIFDYFDERFNLIVIVLSLRQLYSSLRVRYHQQCLDVLHFPLSYAIIITFFMIWRNVITPDMRPYNINSLNCTQFPQYNFVIQIKVKHATSVDSGSRVCFKLLLHQVYFSQVLFRDLLQSKGDDALESMKLSVITDEKIIVFIG